MVTATVSELKADLGAWLGRVQAGAVVVVTDRGRPVARLVPASAGDGAGDRLTALCRSEAVRPGTGKLPEAFWSAPRPSVPGGAAVDALLRDRDGA